MSIAEATMTTNSTAHFADRWGNQGQMINRDDKYADDETVDDDGNYDDEDVNLSVTYVQREEDTSVLDGDDEDVNICLLVNFV